MTVTTTIEELLKAVGKLHLKGELNEIVEMKIEENSIIYKLPHKETGEMIITAYQPVKTIQP